MNLNKKLLLYIIFSLIGFGIFIGTLFKNFNDSFWSSFGIGIIFCSIINIYKIFRYKNDENYAKKITIQINDERNKFLSEKAKSIAFYFYILIMGVGVFVFRIYNYYIISQTLAYSICSLVLLYYLSYFIIRKKY